MEYGPEHSKLVRQVLGKLEDLPIASEALWNYGSRNQNPSVGRLPDYLYPGYQTYPKMVKDSVRNFLRALHGHTLGFLRRD